MFGFENPIPALGIEVGLVDDHRGAVHERGDDPVGRAGHPAGVSSTPVDSARFETEHQAAGEAVGDDRFVHVNGTFGPPGRSAGEVEQRRILRIGRSDLVLVAGGGEQLLEIEHGRIVEGICSAPGDQHMIELGQLGPDTGDLAPVRQRRGHQDSDVSDLHSHRDRFGTERREQRGEDGSSLQRAECCDVERRFSAEQRRHARSTPVPK